MKFQYLKITLLSMILSCIPFRIQADAVGSAPAYCIKYGNHTYARVLTWHSPLIHQDPNDYSFIGAKIKITGLYPRESSWGDIRTYRNNPSWVAWNYYSSGTRPAAVAGSHRATLSLTGSNRGITPTYRRCFG